MIAVIQHPQNKVVHVSTSVTECQHWLHAHSRQLTHSFLHRNETNKLFAASDFYKKPLTDITVEEISNPDVYNFMYYQFLKYFTIESPSSKKQIQPSPSIIKIDIKEYNH